jgi:DNA-binding CsgD family transcriptional regulator
MIFAFGRGGVLVLYGRSEELERVARVFAGAKLAVGGALVIRGEAGIGKTALLREATEGAGHGTLLRAAGHPAESGQPLAFLDLLLRPVRDRFPDLLEAPRATVLADALESGEVGGAGGTGGVGGPGGAGGADGAGLFPVRRAVLELLCGLATERPVFCVVDDAQWLDPASADVLAYAGRRLGAERVALVLAARDGIDEGEARALAGLPELRLGRLGPDAAVKLLKGETLGTHLSPPARERIVLAAEGNPLALREFAASLTSAQRSGRLNPFSFFAGTRTRGGAVHEEFRARLDALPPTTGTLLLVAAADDTRDLILISAAAETLGVEPADLGHAERAGFLQVTGTTVAFGHPLARAAAYQHATTAERRAAHRALAAAAGARTEPRAEARAWHRAAATVGSDEKAADRLEGVARSAAGWQAHAAHARAAELTEEPRLRARRMAAAARTAMDAGLLDGALRLSGEAARLTGDPLTRAELARVEAWVEFERGSVRAACRMLINGAALITDLDPAEAILMLGEAVRCGWHAGDLPLLYRAERAVHAVPPPPDPVVAGLPRALSAVISAFPSGRSGPEADAQAVRSLAEAAAHPLPPDVARRLMSLTFGLSVAAQKPRSAVDQVAECRASGQWGRLPQALMTLAYAALHNGRHREARATTAEALQLTIEAGQLHRASALRCLAGWLAAVGGDEEECLAFVSAGMEHAQAAGLVHTASLGTWALSLLDLAYGRSEEALTRLEEIPPGGSCLTAIRRAPDHIEAAVRCGRPEHATRSLALLRSWGEHRPSTLMRAILERCHALTAPHEADAERHYEGAMNLHEQGGNPYEKARTQLLYGEWLRRARRRGAARVQLTAAAEAFEHLGARPWALRARAELLATGLHPSHGGADHPQASGHTNGRARGLVVARIPGPAGAGSAGGPGTPRDQPNARVRPSSHDQPQPPAQPSPEASSRLTHQELQIVRLAAGGASNREIAEQLFLSPRTVGNHLYRAFPKLGIKTRAELAGLDFDAPE